jgi:hypothetical protein
MTDFRFEPIRVSALAPGGECVLGSFDEIGAFILMKVDLRRRSTAHWFAVRRDLALARKGGKRGEVYEAFRTALAKEGWLAD